MAKAGCWGWWGSSPWRRQPAVLVARLLQQISRSPIYLTQALISTLFFLHPSAALLFCLVDCSVVRTNKANVNFFSLLTVHKQPSALTSSHDKKECIGFIFYRLHEKWILVKGVSPSPPVIRLLLSVSRLLSFNYYNVILLFCMAHLINMDKNALMLAKYNLC